MRISDRLLNGPLGFGAAPLGNMFRNIPDKAAAATVDAAWQQGTRYYDTAPFYGAGLSEIRLGKALAAHKRDEYVLSTKVGRLILDEVETGWRDFGEKGGIFEFGRPNRIVYDYSEHGALKSIEDSLKRLGVDRLDFVWVHDLAQDFHGDAWIAQFETARTGAFRALSRLRDQGVIKGWGLGVNRIEPVELLLGLSEVKPDGTLLAGRYTLLDHERAMQRLMRPQSPRGSTSSSAVPTARASSPAAPTSNIRRHPRRLSPRSSASRRSRSTTTYPLRPTRCSSRSPIPPLLPLYRARAGRSASPRITLR